MTGSRDIAWRRLDVPGLELCHASLRAEDGGNAHGTMLLREEGAWAAFRWHIAWDAAWAAREVSVTSLAGEDERAIRLRADGAGAWRDDAGERPELAGCRDADLGASPFTNTLQLRRLALSPDESAEIEVAWLPLPELAVRRTRQRYTCLARAPSGAAFWRFEDEAGTRIEGIRTDPDGLVTLYPDLFERVDP
jgi:hypothetical protein